MIFSILCLDILDVDASSKGSDGVVVKTGTWNINVSEVDISPVEGNINTGFEYETIRDVDLFDIDYWYFYNYFAKADIFTASPEYYGYKIELVPSSYTQSGSYILSLRPMVGSMTDIISLEGTYGHTLNSYMHSHEIWYETNNSSETISVAVVARLMACYYGADKIYPDLTMKASYEYKVTGYTRSQYEQSIAQGIQDGNDLQEEGNTLIEEGNKLQEDANELQKEENETSKGILSSITEFFSSFFGNLIDTVISIFVPSQEELMEILDQFVELFSNSFGFLMFPFQLLADFVEIVLHVNQESHFVFPGFSIMGHEIWPDMDVNLLEYEFVLVIFEYVKVGTGTIIIFAFINYVRDFFEKRFGGGGS